MATTRYDLFLAHPSANKPSARALYDLLQPDVRVFLDELATPTWRSSARLLEMTANPLMLSTLCLAHYSDTRLPDQRGELYERTLGLLIEVWTRERKGGPRCASRPRAWSCSRSPTPCTSKIDASSPSPKPPRW